MVEKWTKRQEAKRIKRDAVVFGIVGLFFAILIIPFKVFENNILYLLCVFCSIVFLFLFILKSINLTFKMNKYSYGLLIIILTPIGLILTYRYYKHFFFGEPTKRFLKRKKEFQNQALNFASRV